MKEHDKCVFFNDTATTEIYTLSLHDALPISPSAPRSSTRRKASGPSVSCSSKTIEPTPVEPVNRTSASSGTRISTVDRKSTRLNSSHANISYAVFCLKKKYLPLVPLFPSIHL